MTHNELDPGRICAYLDDAVPPEQIPFIAKHIDECDICQATLQQLKARKALVGAALDELPHESSGTDNLARVWAAFERKRDNARGLRWSGARTWWAAAGTALAAAVLLLSVGSVRGWAQGLLAIFRVEHFTVLEVNPEVATNLRNNQMLNQAISRMLSDQVKVTQAPQPPQSLAGEADARKVAGFEVRFVPGMTPTKIVLESGAAAQFTVNGERLQSILDEAGRSDLHMPRSADGSVMSFRIAPGVMTTYDQCALGQSRSVNRGPCITLMEVPSPLVTAPPGFNAAYLAQVGLQFLGMTAEDARNFTETVDWTSTLVLPVLPGSLTYRHVPVDGVEGVVLRPTGSSDSDKYTLTWVNNGIVMVIESYGDDSAAVALAEQLA